MKNNSRPAIVSPCCLWRALTGLGLAAVSSVQGGPLGHLYYWSGPGGNATWNLSNTLWKLDGIGGTATAFGSQAGAASAVIGSLGSAGTVTLGADITAPNVTFGAGGYTLALDGFNLNASVGSLSIGGATVFDFGGTASSATFGNSSGLGWSGTLTITNYVTNTNVLQFGTSSGGLSGAQLSSIIFSGYTDGGAAQINGSGFVTPTGVSAIPEPATYAALLGGVVLGAAGVREHRRRKLAA